MTAILRAVMFVTSGLSWCLSGNAASKGSATAQFLNLGVSARGVAMGDAYSAVADDASALYWNPAALTRARRHSVSLMHATGINGGYFDFGAASENLGGNGAVAAGFQYLSAGRITQTDDLTGQDVGFFGPFDLAASIGYAYTHENAGGFSTGVAGKVIESRILGTAKTWAVDAGVLSPEYLGRMRLAATASNFGGKMRFEREDAPLPFVAKGGGYFKLTKDWLVSADIAFPKDNRPYAAAGTEYMLSIGEGMTVAGRLGFNSRTLGDVAGFTGLSCGMGYSYQGLSVDYAFLPFGLLGSIHRFSLGLRWGGRPGEAEKEEEAEAPEEKTAKTAPQAPTAQDYLAKADAAIAARDFAAAKKHLGAAVNMLGSKDPARARYLERLGYVELQENEIPEARKSYVEGLELARALAIKGPLAADLNAGLGFVLAEEGNDAFAVKFLKKALSLDPTAATRKAVSERLRALGPALP